MSLSSPYQDPALCRALLDRLQPALDGRELRFMEVCGTHTVSIFQSGLRSLLPKEVTHLSGPGCPVCVTHDAEVAAFLDLAGRDGVIIATFGDLLRVPGPGGRSLKHAQAQGARIKIVYSPLDALNIAAAISWRSRRSGTMKTSITGCGAARSVWWWSFRPSSAKWRNRDIPRRSRSGSTAPCPRGRRPFRAT